jgi:hypothetical protein
MLSTLHAIFQPDWNFSGEGDFLDFECS